MASFSFFYYLEFTANEVSREFVALCFTLTFLQAAGSGFVLTSMGLLSVAGLYAPSVIARL
jgi:hypothetical protein